MSGAKPINARIPLVYSVYQNHQGPPRRESQKPFVFNQLCGGEDRIRTGEINEIPDENANLDPDHEPENAETEGLSPGPSVGDRKISNAASDARDPIELAIADAITKAVAAGRFEVLPSLVAELAARRA
jgi:hypothetical protein